MVADVGNDEIKLNPNNGHGHGHSYDDPVTITGIGGRFPESANVDEFWSNLLSGKQLYTKDDRRWPTDMMDLPPKTGKVPNVEKFDSKFFGYSDQQANEMDPQFKLLHETTFEAIIDAGLDPADLRTPKTGMFIGWCYNDTCLAQTFDATDYKVHWMELFSKVSTFFGFKGPCFSYDSACASTLSAFNEAFHCIKSGYLDTAIVSGVSICLNPFLAAAFRQLGMTSSSGVSRCLDQSANGYVRSETICSIVLQRESASKRIYGIILNCKSNSDGFKKEGITFPGSSTMKQLMESSYEDINLDPKEVGYVEAHVTGTQAGDPVECGAIESVFCPNERSDPLLIGCLKSNMGHAEGASGAAAITKACLILQHGLIPPNINYNEANPNITGLMNEKLKPVTRVTKFDGNILSLNSFGFGGTNIHCIIKRYDGNLNQNNEDICDINGINRLILFKSRTESGFEKLRRKIIDHKNDISSEYLSLLGNISNLKDEAMFPYRGYFILNKEKKIIATNYDCFDVKKFENISNLKLFIHLKKGENISTKIFEKLNLKYEINFNSKLTSNLINVVNKDNSVLIAKTFKKSIKTDEILELIGLIYMKGFKVPQLNKLYSTIKYPVSRTTSSLSPLISWNHSKSWTIYKFPEYFRLVSQNKRFSLDYSGFYNFLNGHKVDGRIIVPASVYLWSIWQSFAMEAVGDVSKAYLRTSIEFKDVKLNQAILSNGSEEVSFVTWINPFTGRFEINANGSCIVTGFATINVNCDDLKGVDVNNNDNEEFIDETNQLMISKKDFYKELRVRGYDYEGSFQGVNSCNFNGDGGSVDFLKNWICFADAVLQLELLNDPHRSLYLPTGFDLIKVDGKVFEDISNEEFERYLNITNEFKESSVLDENQGLNENSTKKVPKFQVHVSKETKTIKTKGMLIKGMNGSPAPRKLIKPIMFSYDICNLNENVDEDDEEKINYEKECLDILNSNHENVSKIEENDEKYSLKNVLPQVSKGGLEEIKNHSDQLSNDLLTSVPIESSAMSHIVSIIFDTMASRDINVTEINLSTKSTIETQITSLMTNLFRTISYNYIEKGSNNLKNISSSDLVILQHPNLGFQFLDTVHEAKEKGEKFNEVLKNSAKNLMKNNFLIVIFRTNATNIEKYIRKDKKYFKYNIENIGKDIEKFGLTTICVKNVGNYSFILSRKVENISASFQIFRINNEINFNWIEELKSKIFELKRDEESQTNVSMRKNENEPILIVSTESTNPSGLSGFINCLCKEINDVHGLVIKSNSMNEDVNEIIRNAMKFRLPVLFYENGSFATTSMNKLIKNEGLKLQPNPSIKKTFALNVDTKGDLSSLNYHEISIPDDEFKCEVHYSSLNFKDVMVASGRVPLSAYPSGYHTFNTGDIGMEFSGIISSSGQRVTGSIPGDGIANAVNIKTSQHMIFNVPNEMSLEEAATIPVAYITAYYALIVRGKLFPGESVLIHAGSGGVGQAAINVCKSMNCEIFTTCGSQEKRDFIKSQFNIADDHIFNSRNESFGDDVLIATNGRGVDVVLNSLSGNMLKVGLSCLAVNGRFLEIGKVDFVLDSSFDPSCLSMNQTFDSICVAHLEERARNLPPGKVDKELQLIKKLIQTGLTDGTVKPLPIKVFDCNQAEDAFRYLATGKHIGKVLIKMKEENISKSEENISSFVSRKRVSFDTNKSYIVIGGLGGIGLELCYWLVTKGATKLIITSRTGIRTNYHKFCIKRLENIFGAKVFIKTLNVSKYNEAEELIDFASSIGPIGGIFNLGMVLKDDLFMNQSIKTFQEVCSTKLDATRNLDEICRKKCPNLEHFVCFSSLTGSFGHPGQTNYGYGNSFMDNICRKRKLDGLPGLSLQWGAVGDVGHVAENMGHEAVIVGSIPQRINSCFDTLERCMTFQTGNVGSYVPVHSSFYDDLKSCNITTTILNVLGVKDHSKVDTNATLGDLGLDSLMAVEIKQILEKKYEKYSISTKDIRDMTINSIQHINEQLVSGNVSRRVSRKVSSMVDDVDIVNLYSGFNEPKDIFEVLVFDENIFAKNFENPIFVFPPIEGSFHHLAESLYELYKHVRRPIIAVNWTSQVDTFDTIEEVSKFYLEKIFEKYSNISSFDLIGYSFGTNICIEIALKMKKKNILKNIILLDGSPRYVRMNLINKMNPKDANISKNKTYVNIILEHYGMKMKKNEFNWSDKLIEYPKDNQQFVKWYSLFKKQGSKFNEIKFIESLNRIRNKINICLKYIPKNQEIDSNILLFRSNDETFNQLNEDNYGLDEFICGKSIIFKNIQLNGDHVTFLSNNSERIALEINEFLQE